MQSDNKIEKRPEDNQAEENRIDDLSRAQWLPSGLFRAIGPISLIVIIAGSIAAYYAYNNVTKDSVRLQFWVGFMFSFLAFVVLLVQSIIIARQAEFMEQQSDAMRESVERTDTIIEEMRQQLVAMKREAGAAEDALVISNRASVGVHSIEYDKATKVILVRIENIGLVPAERITLYLEMLVGMYLEDANRGDDVRGFLRFRDRNEGGYGSTKLLRGNLQITRPFYVAGNLSPREIELIEKGSGNLSIRGWITYRDGFIGQPEQRTDFFFFYEPRGNYWTADDPERWGAHYDMCGPADNEQWQGETETDGENPN